ncbi:hypothetical protein BH20ACT15_BH20ACT15_08760 [soil metagenome]
MLAIAAAVLPASAAAAPVATHGPGAGPAKAVGFWTPERMRSAVPLDGPGDAPAPAASSSGPSASAAAQPPDVEIDPARDTAYPERIHGKLFLTLGGQNVSCSGTVVNSRRGNLVLTAGHCVVTPGIGGSEPVWATNVIFVPAYRDGVAPFGTYPATSLRAPTRWVREPLIELDIGAVNLVPGPGGAEIQSLLGARGVSFNRPSRSYRRKGFQIFGYPGEPAAAYDAEWPILCRSRFKGFEPFSGSVVAGPCNMKQGSSGGGFVIGGGLVNSVVSHGTCPPATAANCTRTAGTFFGSTAFKLWSAAGGGVSKGKRKQLKSCKRKRGKKKLTCRARAQTFKPVRL